MRATPNLILNYCERKLYFLIKLFIKNPKLQNLKKIAELYIKFKISKNKSKFKKKLKTLNIPNNLVNN